MALRRIYIHVDSPATLTHRLDLTSPTEARKGLDEVLLKLKSRPQDLSPYLVDDDEERVPPNANLHDLPDLADLFVRWEEPSTAKKLNFEFYVHVQGDGIKAETFRFKPRDLDLKANATIKDVMHAVHARKLCSHPITTFKVCIGDDEADPVSWGKKAWELIRPGDDVFIIRSAADDAEEENSELNEEVKALLRYLKMAAEAMEKNQLARAIEIYTKVLEVAPEEINCAKGLGVVYMKGKVWDKAVAAWENVERIYAKGGKQPAPEIFVEHGKALVMMGQHEKGEKKLGEAIEAIKKGGKVTKETAQDLKTWLGHAMYGKGTEESKRTAGALYTDVLVETDQQHVEAMLGYTKVCQDMGKYGDTFQGLLQVLVANSNNNRIKAALGRVMREVPDSLNLLFKNFSALISEGAAALAFLAVIMKDNGAIPQAIECFKRCCEKEPKSASYALNYAHALEVEGRHWDSLQAVADYCKLNAERVVKVPEGKVSCGEIYEMFRPCCEARDNTPWLSGPKAREWAEGGKVVRWTGDSIAMVDKDGAPPPTYSDSTNSDSAQGNAEPGGGLSSEDLDIIALWFTGIKNLFVLGCVAAIPPFIDKLDMFRRGKALHLTLIRNEQAYFCVAGHLLQYLPLPTPPDLPRLYVCGDSHSLSPSWHTITYGGTTRLLHNALVTGLKCWHLRPDSEFYPKYNFFHVVNSLPDGSHVLMNFGEIDCREGILMAVEKGRYKTIEEGMKTVIGIYLDNLAALQERKGFTIFVHPALPVLDPTRNLVKAFNALLEQELRRHAKVAGNKNIMWLDFFQQLLTPDGNDIQEQYKLDGTHVSPSYLPLVEDSIKKVLQA